MPQSKTLPSQQYSFNPGAMVIVQMGEQLIGHPSTAIGELVKNGYDADATACHVYVHTAPEPEDSFLLVHDNGLGMNDKTLFGDWLRPSISSKRGSEEKNRRSEVFERNFLGSKGIGRLAAMALGRYVTVITKQQLDQHYNWLKIDRESFKTDLGVSQVTFPGGKLSGDPTSIFQVEYPFSEEKDNPRVNPELLKFLRNPRFNKFQEGTLIVIEQVDAAILSIMESEHANMELTIEDSTLVKSLRELITPLELNKLVQNDLIKLGIIDNKVQIAQEISTFNLYYGSSDYLIESKRAPFIEVDPVAILHRYDYRMIGKVEADATVKGVYFCKRLGEEEKVEEPFVLPSSYVLQDDLKDHARRKRAEVPAELVDAQTGPFFFDIRVYDRELEVLEKLGEALSFTGTSAFVKRSARQTLDRYLGFRISKNGFGVKPYGEEQKDWLGINQLRVQDPAHVIGVNQILGNAFLYSPQNDGLSEKTNREGFFENKAFRTFKMILLGILTDLGQRRYNYRQHYNIGRVIPPVQDRPDPDKFIKFIEENSSDPNVVTETKKFVKEYTTAIENIQSSLTFSQRLSSLGQGLELVYHELAQPISVIGATRRRIERKARALPDKQWVNDFVAEADAIQHSTDMLDTLKESLRPAIGITEPREFKPYDTFSKICTLFESDFKRLNIDFFRDEALTDYIITDSEYVLWISFLNLLNNAVYWLGQTESKRIIRFSLEGETLVIENSSPRIPENMLQDIFKYGVTLKKDKHATGLGLSFTQSLLDSNGWEIEARNGEIGPAFYIHKKPLSESNA